MAFYIGMSTYIFPGKCPIYLQMSPLLYWISLSLSSLFQSLETWLYLFETWKRLPMKNKTYPTITVQKANVALRKMVDKKINHF